MEVLSEIEQWIHTHNPTHVITLYGGDMNTDMSTNTPHALAMRQFLSDFNYTACIDTPISEVPYTYISALGSSSRIDHFIVTSALSVQS